MCILSHPLIFLFFFFNDTATTEIYTLSLHDALPISSPLSSRSSYIYSSFLTNHQLSATRSEEHTSELQSQSNLVCRLLLEKKKKTIIHVDENRHGHGDSASGYCSSCSIAHHRPSSLA